MNVHRRQDKDTVVSDDLTLLLYPHNIFLEGHNSCCYFSNLISDTKQWCMWWASCLLDFLCEGIIPSGVLSLPYGFHLGSVWVLILPHVFTWGRTWALILLF